MLDIIKNHKKVLIAILVVALLLILSQILKKGKTDTSSPLERSQSQTTAKANINKTFTFDAKDAKSLAKPITLAFTSVERKDEIKVKGKPKKAPNGKDFLFVRLEIDNKYTQKVAFTPNEIIRLDKDGKLYAPDYHNGRLVLEPLSIRNDSVVFTVNQDKQEFSFQIGELEGEKQKILVKF